MNHTAKHDRVLQLVPAVKPTTAPLHSLSKRAKISAICLATFITLNYVHALFRVLPSHPYLHPFALLLFCHALCSEYFIFNSKSLPTYDQFLTALRENEQLLNCSRCIRPKPPRTRHCSRCARCIPRKSHHCGILSICIGAHNYKPFLHILLLACLSSLIQGVLLVPASLALCRNWFNGIVPLSPGVVLKLQSTYVCLCLSLLFALYLSYHILLTAHGWTTAEAYKSLSMADACPPWHFPHSVFDQGIADNFQQVFEKGFRSMFPNVNLQAVASFDLMNARNFSVLQPKKHVRS